MKKIIALAIAIMMLAALAVPAFAATIQNTETEGETTLSYTLTGTYTVTIPDDFAIAAVGTPVNQTVTASGKLEVGQTLTVTVAGETADAWEMTTTVTGEDDTLAYTVKMGAAEDTATAVEPGDEIFTWAAADEVVATTLWFEVPSAPTLAGEYEDTLTFTIAVADPA